MIANSARGWLGQVYMIDFGMEDIALYMPNSKNSSHMCPPALVLNLPKL